MAATYRTNVRRLDSPGVLAIARTKAFPALSDREIVPPGKCRALLQLPRLVKQFLNSATAGFYLDVRVAPGDRRFFPLFSPERPLLPEGELEYTELMLMPPVKAISVDDQDLAVIRMRQAP